MDPAKLNWKKHIIDPNATIDTALEQTNWPALCCLASSLRDGVPCVPLDLTTNGLNNMARLLQFDDGTLWVARIAMRRTGKALVRVRSEIDTMDWIQQNSDMPVPKIFAYDIGLGPQNVVGSPYILMQFLPGNTGMDSNGGFEKHRGVIPAPLRPRFYRSVAACHVQMTALRLPQIGTVRRKADGSGFEAGPIPGIGGPFDTASDLFKAWADWVKFLRTPDEIVDIMRGAPETQQILQSVKSFLPRLREVGPRFAQHNGNDSGPFPLCHIDFLHSNIIVDPDSFDVLGIIDWEGACTLPLELVRFPRFLELMPRRFGRATRVDEDGRPVDEDESCIWRERQDYIRMVEEAEDKAGNGDHTLSKCLKNEHAQDLAYAIDGFDGGKMGFYDNVLDDIEELLAKQKG